jgi:hypothetical protein
LHYRGTEASTTLKEGATEVNHRDLWYQRMQAENSCVQPAIPVQLFIFLTDAFKSFEVSRKEKKRKYFRHTKEVHVLLMRSVIKNTMLNYSGLTKQIPYPRSEYRVCLFLI